MTQSRRGSLPGFGLTLGMTLVWLGLIVVLPLAGLIAQAASVDGAKIAAAFADPRTRAAFRVSFGASAVAVLIDIPLGLLLAWTLTRYRFPGRRIVDALVDLPFALPTAVAGIALTTLYVDDGWIGAPLARLGVTLAYNPGGIVVALCFVALPFIVRGVQPVLAALDRETEEVAMTLGASASMIVRRVILPPLLPALTTAAAMAMARAVGEYGSVIFIAGNRPAVSEIVPLLIVTRLEQFDYPGAALLGVAMLAASLALLLATGALQRWREAGQADTADG